MKVFNILVDDKLVVVTNNELCLYNHKNLEISSKYKSFPYKESNNPQTVLKFLNSLFKLSLKRLISIGNINEDKTIQWNLPKEIVSFTKVQTKGSKIEPDSYKTDSAPFIKLGVEIPLEVLPSKGKFYLENTKIIIKESKQLVSTKSESSSNDNENIIHINRVLKDSKYEYIVEYKGKKYKQTKILKEAFDYANKELKEDLKTKGIKAKPVYTKID